jgi:hypothetical protein
MKCLIYKQTDNIPQSYIKEFKSTNIPNKVVLINNTTVFKLQLEFDILYINNLNNLQYFSNINSNNWHKGIIIGKEVMDSLSSFDYVFKSKILKTIQKFNCFVAPDKNITNNIINYLNIDNIELCYWNNIKKEIISSDNITSNIEIEKAPIKQTPINSIYTPNKQIVKEPLNSTKNILIIGNDPYLNEFSEIYNDHSLENITTIGINRTFRKIQTDYVSFLDLEIIDELVTGYEEFPYIKDIIPIYNKQFLESRKNDYKSKIKRNQKLVPEHWHINKYYDMLMKEFLDKWPNALNSLSSRIIIPTIVSTIYNCSTQLFKEFNCKFYITCSAFRFNNEQHHFWDKSDLNKNLFCATPDYKKRLESFISVFKRHMIKNKFNITSIQSGSRLNEFCSYMTEEEFFNKFSKPE